MGPKTPPSTPLSESSCQETTLTKDSELEEPWMVISVSALEIDSHTSKWCQEKSKPGICVIGKHDDDAYEVIIDPAYLPGLKALKLQMNLDYDPIQPGEKLKAIYGTYNATRRAINQWLQRAIRVIYSEQQPEAGPAYRHFARLKGLHEELAREILAHDISASTAEVQRKFAQYLVLLVLNLTKDHNSSIAHDYLERDQSDLLQNLQLSLPTPPKRTKRDEAQITSIFRALLEVSGGRVDVLQHGFAAEYTASENGDLCASVLGIIRTRQFGDFDSEEMRNTLSKSLVFSEMTIREQDLEEWITKIIEFLPIGFPKGYLNLPLQVLSGLGCGQVEGFHAYLMDIYRTIPPLQKLENNVLCLLTWSTMVSDRQLKVLAEWARSENGWSLYKQLAKDVQDSQSTEQLSLTIAALMSYRRLFPDSSDDSDQPIKGSYLADLDALFGGHLLGNSGTVGERMILSLIRVLPSYVDQSESLIMFLDTILDRQTPLLHAFDGLSDQYLRRRIDGQPHEKAIVEVSHFNMPDLRGEDDSDWVTIMSPATKTEGSMKQSQGENPLEIKVSTTISTTEEYISPSGIVAAVSSRDECHLSLPSDFIAAHYTIARVSKIGDGNVLEKLDGKTGRVNEVPSIKQLGDGSWEMVVLKSFCRTLQETLNNIFPGSEVDMNHDPLKPTANDVEVWGPDRAKKLYELWFVQRAKTIVKEGWPVAAAYYAYLLEPMDGLGNAAARSHYLDDSTDHWYQHTKATPNSLSTKQIQQLQQKQRIGRDHQSSFWCGFCEKIVALQSKGPQAKDERLNHIEEHFLDKEVIEDWIGMDGSGGEDGGERWCG